MCKSMHTLLRISSDTFGFIQTLEIQHTGLKIPNERAESGSLVYFLKTLFPLFCPLVTTFYEQYFWLSTMDDMRVWCATFDNQSSDKV